MECIEIRERLSEYLDGFLDPETEARVRRHLTSCKACAAELASLKSLAKELGELESIEAPADFLARLHEKMERPSGLSKILDTLFRPFKIKIPLEFAGVAAVAIMVFIVLNVRQPGEELSYRPLPEKQTETARRVAPVAAPEQVRPAPPRHERLAKRKAPAAPKQRAMLKAPRRLLAIEDLKEDKVMGRHATIELALVIRTDRPRLKASAPADSIDALESMPAETKKQKGVMVERRSRPRALGQTLNAVDEEKEAPAAAAGATPAYKDRRAPSSAYQAALFPRLRELVELNHGKVLSVEYEEGTLNPRSILVEIPADRVKVFSDSLQSLGDLKTPHPILSEDTGETIQVRIRFLHPG